MWKFNKVPSNFKVKNEDESGDRFTSIQETTTNEQQQIRSDENYVKFHNNY